MRFLISVFLLMSVFSSLNRFIWYFILILYLLCYYCSNKIGFWATGHRRDFQSINQPINHFKRKLFFLEFDHQFFGPKLKKKRVHNIKPTWEISYYKHIQKILWSNIKKHKNISYIIRDLNKVISRQKINWSTWPILINKRKVFK